MYYVYVIRSRQDGTFYTGYTNDLKRRLAEHNDKVSTYTKHKAPFQLVYYEAYRSRADAKYRENNLKRFGGAMTHLKKRIRNSAADFM